MGYGLIERLHQFAGHPKLCTGVCTDETEGLATPFTLSQKRYPGGSTDTSIDISSYASIALMVDPRIWIYTHFLVYYVNNT